SGAGAPGEDDQRRRRAAGLREARAGGAHHRLGARRDPAALPADRDGDLVRKQLDDVLPDPDRLVEGILRLGDQAGDAPGAAGADRGRVPPRRADEDQGPGLAMPAELISRAALERIIQRAAELQAAERDIGDGLTKDEVLALGQDVGIPTRYLQQALLEEQTRSVIEEGRGTLAWLTGPTRLSAALVAPRHRAQNERIQVGLEQVLDRLERGEIRPEHALPGPRGNPLVRIAEELRKAFDTPGARPRT